METGITEIFELAGSKGGITVEVTVAETYDTLQNTSDVSVGLRVKSSSYYNYTYYLSGTVKLNGTTLVEMDSTVPTHYAQTTALNSYAQVNKWSSSYVSSPWTLTGISHNNDGSRALTLEIALKGYTSGGGGGSGWSVVTSRTIQLTHIPRASTIGATDADIGAVSMVAVTRRSVAYTHSIGYAFGSMTGYLTEAGGTSQEEQKMTASGIAFSLPETFYEQIPDSPTGICTLTCRTYLEDVQIGTEQSCSFTVTAAREQCAPVISGTVTDCNPDTVALTGDADTLVRYVSNGHCTVNAVAQKGAALVSKTVAGVQIQEDSIVMAGVRENRFLFTCTDSRGYTASTTVEKPMIPYIPLTANATVRRTDPTSGNAVVTVTGNCYHGSFGAVDNTLQLCCKVDGGEEIVLTAQISENSYRAEGLLTGLDYRRSHTVTVTAADSLQSLAQTVTVGKGIPVFDWGEEDFVFHVPVTAPSINGHANLMLAAYPVGSVYLRTDSADPAALFGGTWEQMEELLTGIYAWKRLEDPKNDSAVLGMGILGQMILGKET